MRLSSIPQSLSEAAALALGIVPTPLMDTLVGVLLARAVIAATAAGLFDALEQGPLPTSEVSLRCKTDTAATEKLLRALCGSGYLAWEKNHYRLTRVSRRWLLRAKPNSVRSAVIHRDLDLRFMRFEDYLRDGKAQNFHGTLSPEDWEIYHAGQADQAALISKEVVNRVALPAGARNLLDLGGGHGLHSFAFCEQYPHLCAQVLDLEVTYGTSASFRVSQSTRERVSFQAVDILDARLPEVFYDAVLMANVLHHFDMQTIRPVFKRIASSLRPGGVLIVLDAVRPSQIDQSDQLESLLDLYFGATSGAGLWTVEEIQALQAGAGLLPSAPRALRLLPCCKLQIAQRVGP